jgi:hypothetical protein
MPIMPSSQILLLMIALTGLTCLGAGLVLIVMGVGLLMRKPTQETAHEGHPPAGEHFYDSAPTDPRG